MTGDGGRDAGWIGRSGVVLSSYYRRLLSPPLPGDGLLLFGFVEGVVGWGLSWMFSTNPSLAPFGLIESIVAVWIALTGGIVLFGIAYTAPTVRRNRVWLVWGGLNVAATLINVAALAGVVPSSGIQYAYWHPWLVVLGVGYLVTALYNRGSPQIRRRERMVYAGAGITSLGLLIGSFGPLRAVVTLNVFVIGGLLHLVPMGYDVVADAVLIARRQ